MSTDAPEGHSYILDPESLEEMARLINIDRVITKAMGGALTGIEDVASLHSVVDLACGPGGWALDVAYELSECEVTGVDVSKIMTDYANARARSQKLLNANFVMMNVSQKMNFPDASFDLVNARSLFAVLYRDAWPSFIEECSRILRPGGILRLTEPVTIGFTTSKAREKTASLFYQALQRIGYGFSPSGQIINVTTILPRLLRNAGYKEIRHIPTALEFSVGTEAWSDFYRDFEVVGKLGQGMLAKVGVATKEEAADNYQQALIEMHAEDFSGMVYYHTFVVKKS